MQNDTFWTQNRHFLINLTLLKQKGTFLGRKKPPEAAAGHDTLVLRTKTLLAGMAHGRADRTSRRAEIPPPEEAALRAASTKGGGRPPLWTPLVEESQPSGLSGPYAHAPCWLKVSLSLKLRCRAPQLPPAVLSGPKSGQGRKLVKQVSILKRSLFKGSMFDRKK